MIFEADARRFREADNTLIPSLDPCRATSETRWGHKLFQIVCSLTRTAHTFACTALLAPLASLAHSTTSELTRKKVMPTVYHHIYSKVFGQ